jgi:L-threonylcarbamoyladenylate synthase
MRNIIEQAAQAIREGEIVAFPTETVYGLGANALNPEAVAKIFAAKERPSFDPLIVHISQVEDLYKLTKTVDERILALAKAFWPGPLTIVLPKSDKVPDIVTSGLPTVGIRMPNNEIALQLISEAACPIAAPSANKFGRISPTTASHVKKQLPDLKHIIDGGACKIGIESTVIAVHDDGFKILRQGFITKEDLEKILPESKLDLIKEHQLASPGLLNSHYSPKKPFYIRGQEPINTDFSRCGYIYFGKKEIAPFLKSVSLSSSENLIEAAIHLFHCMHLMEDSDVDVIIADSVPEIGIGKAIMDKLKKASFDYVKKASV